MGRKVILLLSIDKNEKRAFDALPSLEASSVDENLVSFARNILDGTLQSPSTQNYSLGKASEREVADIESLIGVDAAGFTHNIKGGAIKHIENRHGKNGIADRSMADISDYGRIRYVLDNYDDVSVLHGQDGGAEYSGEFKNADNTPAPMVTYKKRVNGNFYVVEAVPDSRAQKLQIVSAYKTPAKKTGAGKS